MHNSDVPRNVEEVAVFQSSISINTQTRALKKCYTLDGFTSHNQIVVQIMICYYVYA